MTDKRLDLSVLRDGGDKIKTLLESPSVKSVTVEWREPEDFYGNTSSHVADFVKFGPCNEIEFCFIESCGDQKLFDDDDIIDSVTANFYEWPELRAGDLVMTEHGQGEVMSMSGSFPHHINVGGTVFDIPVHEIALLQKAEDNQ